ncbi:MAG: peptide ABC transporter substrate-binding protein, partial [Planctomycetes bacterium]|nr:peptide ABC transporter substrate-binding protein [Planctomycetota bacterium]
MAALSSSRHTRAAVAIGLIAALGLALASFAARSGTARADFVFTGGGEVRSIDPHAITGVPEGRVIRLLYEGLVAREPQSGRPVPGAAEAWQLSQDGLTYTFRLRSDALWSNGDRLTAADFEWSFRRLLAPETAAEYAPSLFCIAGARAFSLGESREWASVGVRALDERQLEMRLERPVPYFLDLLSNPMFAPVHRASLERLRQEFPATWASEWTRPERLVVNGPFRLVERRIADRMRFERNEHYWDAQHVALRTIDVLAIESWNTALNLYLTGAVDWVDGAIPTTLASALSGREDYTPRPYLAVYFYRVNTTKPPLDDWRVRRALAMALEREVLCKDVLKAGQLPADTFVPPRAIAGYSSPAGVGENIQAARELLLQAGFGAQGKPFPALELHYNTAETHRDIAEVVAEQWRRNLGIEVHLRNQEWKSFLDAQSKLDYDVSRSSWIADYADPSTFLEIWTSESENNRTGWSNAGYDAVIAQARATADPRRRMELYATAESTLLHDLPCIPLFVYVSQNLVDPRVGGFGAN